MRKLSIILVIALCLSLCACDLGVNEAPPAASDVHITAGGIVPGMTAKDVLVEVTIDNQPVACRMELTCFTPEGYYTMVEDEPVPEDFMIRLDVFYSLPKGIDVDHINVVMECDGGNYDGTGSIGHDANGCVEAWSHAFYGEEPQPQDQTEPETQPVTEPEAQLHTHNWTEVSSGYVYINCTSDREVTYTCGCGESKTETVPAPGHDIVVGSTIQPTCTETGITTSSCKRCGAGFINEQPATGHAWSAWSYATGRMHKRVCETCGAEEEASHNIPSGSVTCTDCGADIVN